jgi:hypothetical protein
MNDTTLPVKVQGDVDKNENLLRFVEQEVWDPEISYEAASKTVPDGVYNYLAWVLTEADATIGEHGRVILSQIHHEKVLYVAQDLTAGVTNQPMPQKYWTCIAYPQTDKK